MIRRDRQAPITADGQGMRPIFASKLRYFDWWEWRFWGKWDKWQG